MRALHDLLGGEVPVGAAGLTVVGHSRLAEGLLVGVRLDDVGNQPARHPAELVPFGPKPCHFSPQPADLALGRGRVAQRRPGKAATPRVRNGVTPFRLAQIWSKTRGPPLGQFAWDRHRMVLAFDPEGGP